MSGALLFTGLTAVGNGFFIKMIYDTYDVLKNTATYEYPYLQRVLRDLDLKANLQVIESLLSKVQKKELIEIHAGKKLQSLEDELNKHKNQALSGSIDGSLVEDYTNKKEADEYYHKLEKQIKELAEFQKVSKNQMDPLQICFQNVNDMVNLIKEELERVQEIIKKHEEKYFFYWRTPAYSRNLKKIIGYKKSLDQRVEILIKILSLEK